MKAFFDRLSPNLEDVPPNCIFNYDETAIKDDPGAEEAFFGGGQKYFEQVKNSSKVAYSVMFCVSADGTMLPPYTVYKSPTGALYDLWCEGGPKGAGYGANKSGWFDQEKFNAWFKFVFLKFIRSLPQDQIKVLIGDNLAAHFSPYVISMCEKYNVRFLFLPENSTHLLQPLDVAVFSPLKKQWRRVLTGWKEDCVKGGKEFATLPKQEFPSLLVKLLEKDYGPAITAGFEACGIYPLNADRALSRLPPEQREVETEVQRQLLQQLETMRYGGKDKATRASRPKKSQKLPPGATYTCGIENQAGLATCF